jgi:hypothetical protein
MRLTVATTAPERNTTAMITGDARARTLTVELGASGFGLCLSMHGAVRFLELEQHTLVSRVIPGDRRLAVLFAWSEVHDQPPGECLRSDRAAARTCGPNRARSDTPP